MVQIIRFGLELYYYAGEKWSNVVKDLLSSHLTASGFDYIKIFTACKK